jgi:hypothetical protein
MFKNLVAKDLSLCIWCLCFVKFYCPLQFYTHTFDWLLNTNNDTLLLANLLISILKAFEMVIL